MKSNIFKFDGEEIKNFIRYELNLYRDIKNSFEYTHAKLFEIGYGLTIEPTSKVNLNSIKWDKGKNYDWLAITSGDVSLIIRKYDVHFTIYSKLNRPQKFADIEIPDGIYGAFTFETKTDTLSGEEADSYFDNPYKDLNALFHDMVKIISNNRVHTLWNDCSFNRPSHCRVKNIYEGESVVSIDNLIFCAEELSSKHVELFAENDMLAMLKKLKNVAGKRFDGKNKIKSVVTKFPKNYSSPYYHGVGIIVVDEKKNENMYDVYKLTQWYIDEVEKLVKP